MSPATNRPVIEPSRVSRAQSSAMITVSPSAIVNSTGSLGLPPASTCRAHPAASSAVTAGSPILIVSSVYTTSGGGEGGTGPGGWWIAVITYTTPAGVLRSRRCRNSPSAFIWLPSGAASRET